MFNYQDNQRPIHNIPSMADYDRVKNLFDRYEHTGFCLGPYNSETCNVCYCESDCLELRNMEILEYLVEPYV